MWLITHRRYFVSVENECYAAAAVVQMAAVWLALGGYMWRWRSNHWTNPPLMTRGGEAGEVAMLQTFLSSRTGLVTARWLEPARTATTQHLVLQGQNIHLDVRQHSHCHFFLESLVTMLKYHVGVRLHMKAFSFMLLEIFPWIEYPLWTQRHRMEKLITGYQSSHLKIAQVLESVQRCERRVPWRL